MRFTIVESSIPKPIANYSEAVIVDDLIFAAGQLPTDFKTGIPDEAKKHPAFPFYGSDIKLQTEYVLKNLAKTFEAAGSSLEHVVKAQVFLTDLADFAAFDEVWKKYFSTPPARTTVEMPGLLVKDALIEIDLIGYKPRAGLEVRKVRSEAPAPLANYTEAFVVGDLVFAAGQFASDFKTGIPDIAKKNPAFPFYGSEIKLQTEYILDNLKKTMTAAGSSFGDIVKAQVFLTNLDDFAQFDEVWKKHFTSPPPRTTVQITQLLAKDTLIEIDLIGGIAGAPRKQITSDAPKPIANYAEAIQVGRHVFAAGQFASDFKTGIPPEAKKHPAFPFYGSEIKLQTHYILKNLQKTFAAAGCTFEDISKAQVFLTDLNDFNAFDEVWKEYFKQPPPRTTIAVSGLLAKGVLVEIDLIGVAAS